MAFRFLKSFFTAPTGSVGKYDDMVIAAAIERVVDGTDPRLRAVSRYRHKLWDAVAHSVAYTVKIIDRLPPSIDASHRSFIGNPLLRAAFVSPNHLRETLSFSKHTHDYQHQNPGRLPAELYGLLGMDRVEKTVLGIDRQGDLMRRDVPQTTVNFCNHHFVFPTESEQRTRQELTKRAFDSLIEVALTQLTETRVRRQALEQQQRQILQKKASALKSGQMGLGPLLAATPLNQADASTLERRLLDIQEELQQIRADSATIEQLLAQVAATLREPEKHLQLEQISLTLDHMNIKASPDSSQTVNALTFDEALLGMDRRMTVLLIRFPTSELLPQPDFFQEAQKLLTPRLMT